MYTNTYPKLFQTKHKACKKKFIVAHKIIIQLLKTTEKIPQQKNNE